MESSLKRRRWLDRFVKTAVGVVVAVFGFPLFLFLVAPAFRKGEEGTWLRVGPIKNFRPGEPRLVVLRYQFRDGWIIRTARMAVYVVVKGDGSVKVFSTICTHANCSIRWEREKKAFFCPCHDGYFDIDGRVKSGPPPRPLQEFPHRVEDGSLFVRV